MHEEYNAPLKKIALIGCSNGNTKDYVQKIRRLESELHNLNLDVVTSETVYTDENDQTKSASARAHDLTQSFLDETIDAVFDITGGDAANAVLPYLDFKLLSRHPKPFFAYSDNSVLLNPLHQLSNIPVFYFQLKNILDDETTLKNFQAFLTDPSVENNLTQVRYRMLQGTQLSGKEIAGGNMRCTLKLFGTPFQPDFTDRIFFIESYGGSLTRVETSLLQYQMSGAFKKCSSVLIGNFSEINSAGQMDQLYNLVLKIIDDKNLPVAITTEVGHQNNSRCLSYQTLENLVLSDKNKN